MTRNDEPTTSASPAVPAAPVDDVARQDVAAKKQFIEPVVSPPTDVLEDTGFFQFGTGQPLP